ncbi:MAG TPA: hypothetical protein VFY64_07125 [Nitrososphaeraceae archaeon]|nr:hypothetical protein [Nitrososphaeraceae archaeon]
MSHKSSKPIIFYSLLAAGFMFIIVGFIIVYSYSKPAEVPLHGILNAGMTDILTPNMNMGGMANVIVKGSIFNVTIADPAEHIIKSETRRTSDFKYNFTAEREGEHKIEINNIGTSDLYIEGYAQNKLNVIALSGPLMLIITGIIITGLAIRFKKR